MKVSESAEMIARSKGLWSDRLTVRSDRDVTVSITLLGADPRFRACGDNLYKVTSTLHLLKIPKNSMKLRTFWYKGWRAMLAQKVSV